MTARTLARHVASLPLLTSLALTGAVATLVALVAAPAVVTGDSMAPTLAARSVVLVRGGPSQPGRGDIVVLEQPAGSGLTLVKRVVAIGGDTVAHDGVGGLAVNGEAVGPDPRAPDPHAPAYTVTVVPRGACFVAGDNRVNSTDSRDFGCVAVSRLEGHITWAAWPPAAWGRVR